MLGGVVSERCARAYRASIPMRLPTISALAAVAFLVPPAPAQYVEAGATRLFAIPGRQTGDLFGWRVRCVGDTNADGTADFAVAAPFHNLNVGRVSVHSGR